MGRQKPTKQQYCLILIALALPYQPVMKNNKTITINFNFFTYNVIKLTHSSKQEPQIMS